MDDLIAFLTAKHDLVAAVTAVAAWTAAAGALLSFLRARSGSLAAPVTAHLAVNCTAPLASALARALDR